MAFHEVLFPIDISYNSQGGPGYRTNTLELDSGAESRVSTWANARRKYNVAYGIKTQLQLATMTAFFLARMGAAHGFRYKDYADYTTAQDGISAQTNLDVAIGVGDGATLQFQLVKKYVSGPSTITRRITKPVNGTITVALNGVNQTSGWSVDTTSGLLTFAVAPGVGVVVTVGFQFDVPVRFADDVDKALMGSIDDFSTRTVQGIHLIEIKDDTIQSDDYNYGGAAEHAISTDMTLSYGLGRVRVIAPASSGLAVYLPDATDIPAGGTHFHIINDSATHAIAIKTPGGTTLVSLAAGAICDAILSVDGGGTKVWYVH